MCVGMVMRPDCLHLFQLKSGNCLERRLSAVSVAKNHPRFSDTLIPTNYEFKLIIIGNTAVLL